MLNANSRDAEKAPATPLILKRPSCDSPAPTYERADYRAISAILLAIDKFNNESMRKTF